MPGRGGPGFGWGRTVGRSVSCGEGGSEGVEFLFQDGREGGSEVGQEVFTGGRWGVEVEVELGA